MRGLARFLSPKSSLSGKAYFFWGLVLFAIKYPLDHMVAVNLFSLEWHPFVYYSVLSNPLFQEPQLNAWLGMLCDRASFSRSSGLR